MSSIPHLFQYQGSKRRLAKRILDFFPNHISKVVEPFAGTGAVSLAASRSGKANSFWLNDVNKPLIELIKLAVENPSQLAESYEELWTPQEEYPGERYLEVRDLFNNSKDPCLLLYLLSRCVKGSVRYNSSGLFNQSPDKRRKGTHPERMRKNILGVSKLLKEKCCFTDYDYKKVLSLTKEDDLIYLDPPYQGVCSNRDTRYSSQIDFDDFVSEIKKLNQRRARFIVSYDGKVGQKHIGESLPENLNLLRIELDAGRSSQSTLLGRSERTTEFLYISSALSDVLANLRVEQKTVHVYEQLALPYYG